MRYNDYGGSMKILTKFMSDQMKDVTKYTSEVENIDQKMKQREGRGSEFLGWTNYVSQMDSKLVEEIEEVANEIRNQADVLLVCGIGGSYLGARAIIDALTNPYEKDLEILFLGNSLSSEHLLQVKEHIRNKRVYVNVISKSGRTLETALAFRFVKEWMEEKYQEEANTRIIATTDKERGALKELSNKQGYRTFVIPDDIGGRYSVFTPVGLLPIAAAGINIRELLAGVKEGEVEFNHPEISKNLAYEYACYRTNYYQDKKNIELLVSYDESLRFTQEWYKQLFGESEGKENKGIFPASLVYTTDLHSMGQYLQQGQRNLFETVLSFKKSADLKVNEEKENLDQLNYLAGKSVHEINQTAMLATALAHFEGGCDSIFIELEEKSAHSLGKLYYFFMKACAMSAYLLGVNPFDQPGVEGYKDNMFALLDKPGTEEMGQMLKGKIYG